MNVPEKKSFNTANFIFQLEMGNNYYDRCYNITIIQSYFLWLFQNDIDSLLIIYFRSGNVILSNMLQCCWTERRLLAVMAPTEKRDQ